MLARSAPDLLLNFVTKAEEVGENFLKVAEMLLHALSLNHLQLVELPPEEEGIGERSCHVQLLKLRSQHHRRSLVKDMDHHLIR